MSRSEELQGCSSVVKLNEGVFHYDRNEIYCAIMMEHRYKLPLPSSAADSPNNVSNVDTSTKFAPCELEFEHGTYHATFEVTATVVRKGSKTGEITVQYTTTNATARGGQRFGPGVDYISMSGTLTFKDGERFKEITISVDDDVEETKIFCIYLKNQSSGATIGENGVAIVMVTGDEILDVSCQRIDKQEAEELLKHSDVYPIKHRPKGLAVIINNKKFDSGTNLAYRDGSEFDEENLLTLFENLGFKCDRTGNKTAEQMRTIFKRLSERDYTHYDALFVCVMSHGTGYNTIYGTDGGTIHAQEEIIQPFWKNTSLKNKPKVFLLQSNRDLNSRKVSSSSKEAEPDTPAMDTREDGGINIVDSLNTLRISAAAPGTISFRHNSGSWFIRSFVQVTAKYAHREDVRSIVYRVRDVVKRKIANRHLGEEHHERQCIDIHDSGFNTLYLLPGYPPKP